MPSRSTIIPAIRRPAGGGDVESHLRGISKQIQQFRRLNIPSRAGSGDTTVQLVQCSCISLSVVWCGVVWCIIVSRIHSARVAYKRNPVCVLPGRLTRISGAKFIIST